MKTLHNIKTGFLTLGLILFTYTVSQAQKSTNTIVDQKIARVMASTPVFTEFKLETVSNKVNAPTLNFVIETPVMLENWMTNLDSWAPISETEASSSGALEDVVKEEDVKLEAWMFDFSIEATDDEIQEPELALEDWMFSPENWGN